MKQISKLLWLAGLLPLGAQAGVVGTGTAASCTETALSTALAAAKTGEVIGFRCGTTAVTIPITTEKFITVSGITLDGYGKVTLDGKGKSRILRTDTGYALQSTGGFKFTLKNINLNNGFTTDQGGAFQVGYWNNLVIDNVTFQNNKATRDTKTCDGGGALFIGAGSRATISNSRFIGNSANNGGAINNLRTDLTVSDSVFTNNKAIHSDAINKLADCGGGGAIYIDGAKKESEGGGGAGALKILRSKFNNNTTNHLGGALFSFIHGSTTIEVNGCTFSGNVAKYWVDPADSTHKLGGSAGAIYHQRNDGSPETATAAALMYLKNSTIVNNRAEGELGGGVRVQSPAQIVNSTFTGNSVENVTIPATDVNNWRRGHGGALVAGTGTTIINSTIAKNKAAAWGGAISGQSVTLKNTIIANNTGSSGWKIQQNCTANMIDGGNNIQFPARLTSNGNDYECIKGQAVVDPLLGLLADNGGLTQTMALLTGSPAINKGGSSNCPTTDQRSAPRVLNCDIGAFEASSTTPPVASTVPAAAITKTGSSTTTTAAFKGTVVNNSTDKVGNTVSQQDTVTISSTVAVDKAHVGQPANIVLLAAYTPNTRAARPEWFTRSGSDWQSLGTNFTTDQLNQLQVADSRDALDESEEINIFSGALQGLPGKIDVYAAYKLADETLVFNLQPINVSIDP